MKKFIVIFLFINSIFLSAQSTANEIEALLNSGAVTYAQAARFILQASDTLVTANPAEAFSYAMDRKWLPKKASADGVARLDGISLLFMQSFNQKGGIFYSITKNPHYAYRELAYKNYFQGRADPAMDLSGDQLIFITGKFLSARERDEDASAESERAALAAEEERQRRIAEDERQREAAERNTALAQEINIILEELNISDTKAEATDEGAMITLSNIQFMADSAELPAAELGKLQEIANILRNIPGRKIHIAGHAALAGTIDLIQLSHDRAIAVAEYLILLGARAADEITTVGYGTDRPIADNSTPEGMAANRRVEITILEN